MGFRRVLLRASLIATCIGTASASGGGITFADASLSRKPSHQRVRNGLSFVPEGRQVIGTLTVLENLGLGRYWLSRRDRPLEVANILEMFPRTLADSRVGKQCVITGKSRW